MNPPPPPPPPPGNPGKSPGPPQRPPPPRPPSAELKAKAETTFLSALDEPAAGRDSFVAKICGEDEDLADEVHAMLQAHREAGDFMADPPLSPELEAELVRLKPEEAGDRIGPYKLLEEIGEG